jgi:hypothetical protein
LMAHASTSEIKTNKNLVLQLNLLGPLFPASSCQSRIPKNL